MKVQLAYFVSRYNQLMISIEVFREIYTTDIWNVFLPPFFYLDVTSRKKSFRQAVVIVSPENEFQIIA